MKYLQLIPELLVEDMQKSIDFYVNVLGFKEEIVFPEKSPVFAQMGKNDAHIMLYIRNEFENEIPSLKNVKMGGSTLLYIRAAGVESLYAEIKDKVKIVQPFHKTDYGKIEFAIEDCNGYLITFSEDIKD